MAAYEFMTESPYLKEAMLGGTVLGAFVQFLEDEQGPGFPDHIRLPRDVRNWGPQQWRVVRGWMARLRKGLPCDRECVARVEANPQLSFFSILLRIWWVLEWHLPDPMRRHHVTPEDILLGEPVRRKHPPLEPQCLTQPTNVLLFDMRECLMEDEFLAPRYEKYFEEWAGNIMPLWDRYGRVDLDALWREKRLSLRGVRTLQMRDVNVRGWGIYLHVIVDRFDVHRGYAGQAKVFARRHGDHNNEKYRYRNPSLHYYAMNNYCQYDYWVLIASGEDAIEQLQMNILEKFVSLVFQTGQPSTLDPWLWDYATRSTDPGLNVADPLMQGVANVVGWSRGAIKSSKDPMAHEYFKWRKNDDAEKWLEKMRNNGLTGSDIRRTNAMLKAGVKVGTQIINGDHLTARVHSVLAQIPRRANRDDVWVRCELVDWGRHPNAFDPNVKIDEDCARLGIECWGTLEGDKPFKLWLYATWPNHAQFANRLVDFLEGRSPAESAELPNRKIEHFEFTDGRRLTVTTEDKKADTWDDAEVEPY